MKITVPLRLSVAVWLALCGRPTGVRAADINQGWVEVRSPHFTVATNAGEKDGRRIADQFEQIRSMFQTMLPKLLVDPPQPIVILAAKNENTMKVLVPEDWEVKGHIHHAGIYQQGEDKHYVLMQLDTEGNNPFHTLYHEYTHALLHLNFSSLPLWLDEGIAEFFGNSTLGDKESKTGTIDQGHLYILRQNKLLPIETLLGVDQKSPYYNETNRASVFYAQSWAVVHYLTMDPDATQKQLMGKFLAAWEKSGNQTEAAREAFGDLNRFGKTIEGYVRQGGFYYKSVKSSRSETDKNYATRAVSSGEVLALRGDASAHRNRLDEAQALLEQSVQSEPKLAMAHEALGFCKYRKQEFKEAGEEMDTAIQLGSNSFAVFYYHGMILLHSPTGTAEAGPEAVKSLERATQINPQFAPAFEWLAQAYSRKPEAQKQAIDAGIQAVKLDPATKAYTLNLAYLLLSNNRDADARLLGTRLSAAAHSPEEAQKARDLLDRVAQHEQWKAQSKARSESAATFSTEAPGAASSAGGSTAVADTSGPGIPMKMPTSMGVDGPIGAVDCSHRPEITITLDLPKGSMTFHAEDFGLIGVSAQNGEAVPSLRSCAKWPGHQAKIWFTLVQGKDYMGEITKIYFH